jgi:hypothetical protein
MIENDFGSVFNYQVLLLETIEEMRDRKIDDILK